ncbi:MAG: NrpR regulatory domain-containing protein [bacterium]
MDERTKKHQIEILKILKDAEKPMGSVRIVEELAAAGVEMKDRTVRFHLRRMDELGLTHKVSRRTGRTITPLGAEELEHANVIRRISFIVSKIEGLSYNMTFGISKKAGTVVLNVSYVPLDRLTEALGEIELAFRAGLGMGRLVLLKGPGEKVGRSTVPEDMVGIGTVCSVTLNGALLKAGVPVVSRYGCLLRIENGEPAGFTELVDYLGASLDPLELFLRAGMTSVGRAARGGSGLVGASFREVPAAVGRALGSIEGKLRAVGLGGVLAVGKPNQPLLNVPVNEGMIGVVVVGGINPIAAAHEIGIRTENIALHSLVDYGELYDFEKLRSEIRRLSLS